MRPDMAKVLTERPRGGARVAGKGYLRAWQKTLTEDLPTREGIKRRSRGGSKWFTDCLGPLRRYLRSSVGRPWDLVYSEIVAGTRRGFPVREHFLLHVFQYVERSVILVDGVPCHGEGRWYGTPLSSYANQKLYVCPSTGLLRQVPGRRRRHG